MIWPGFILLMRVALFFHLVHNSNKLGVASVCFLIMSLGGIFPHGVYKKWKLNVLEFLFLLNLSVTFVVVEYYGRVHSYKRYGHYKYVAAYLSVSFTLFLSVGILFYHVYD